MGPAEKTVELTSAALATKTMFHRALDDLAGKFIYSVVGVLELVQRRSQ